MQYQEFKQKVRTEEITEITSPLSGRTFKVRWNNRRIETLAPASSAWPNPGWQSRNETAIVADFLTELAEIDLDLIVYD